jgi:hypothetical protein
LKFKNIILDEKLSNKFKNSHENFSGARVSMDLGLLAGISYNHEVQRFTVFEFVGQFYFQNDNFNVQEDLSEPGSEYFLENVPRSFHAFLILKI